MSFFKKSYFDYFFLSFPFFFSWGKDLVRFCIVDGYWPHFSGFCTTQVGGGEMSEYAYSIPEGRAHETSIQTGTTDCEGEVVTDVMWCKVPSREECCSGTRVTAFLPPPSKTVLDNPAILPPLHSYAPFTMTLFLSLLLSIQTLRPVRNHRPS